MGQYKLQIYNAVSGNNRQMGLPQSPKAFKTAGKFRQMGLLNQKRFCSFWIATKRNSLSLTSEWTVFDVKFGRESHEYRGLQRDISNPFLVAFSESKQFAEAGVLDFALRVVQMPQVLYLGNCFQFLSVRLLFISHTSFSTRPAYRKI